VYSIGAAQFMRFKVLNKLFTDGALSFAAGKAMKSIQWMTGAITNIFKINLAHYQFNNMRIIPDLLMGIK
jgi:hypothetical protein